MADLTDEQLQGMAMWGDPREVMLRREHQAVGAYLVSAAVAELQRRRAEQATLVARIASAEAERDAAIAGAYRSGQRVGAEIFTAESVLGILADRKTQTRRVIRIDDTPISAADCDAGKKQRGIPRDARNVRMLGYLKCDTPPGSHTVSSRVECPYGLVGDRLWVKEAHAQFAVGNRTGRSPQCVAYRASCGHDGEFDYVNNGDEIMGLKITKWTSPLFMPRWASRITLEITEVRVQRVQEVSGRDVLAEGVDNGKSNPTQGVRWENMQRLAFEAAWDAINGKRRRREYLEIGHPDRRSDRPWRTVVDESAAWAANPWVWAITFRRVP